MKVPEKIYMPKELLSEEWTRHIEGEDVEYVCIDTFIEKAVTWLKNHYRDYMYNPTGERLEAFFGGDMITDFENFLKGVK